MMQSRITNLRALAIILVITIHVSAIFTSMSVHPPIYYGYIFVDAITHFAVPLFVFVSGYALITRYKGENRIKIVTFLKRRVFKILPSYVFFSFIYFYLFTPDVFSYKNLNALLTGGAAYHLYFVIVIFQLYLLFPIVFMIKKRLKEKGYILIVLAFILQFSWYLLWLKEPASAKINTLFPYLPFFMLGIFHQEIAALLANAKSVPTFIIKRLAIPVSAFLGGSIAYIWSLGNESFGRFYKRPLLFMAMESALLSVMSLLLVIVAYLYIDRINTRKKLSMIIRLLGEYSYELYLSHVFVLYYLVKYSPLYGLPPTNLLYFPVILTLTLSLSLLIAFLYKKSAKMLSRITQATFFAIKKMLLPSSKSI